MEGGTKEVTLRLCLNSTKENPNGKKVWCSKVTFYEGDIQLDAILSHPWLAHERLGVFPHLEGLARLNEGETDPLTILSSWGQKWQVSKNLRAAHILEGKVVDENDPLGQKALGFDEEAYYSSPWDTD